MECPGATKCSHGDVCFAERARKRATEADVLVVNHALYCVHLDSSGAVLPEHDLVVFDEAHGLADVATTTFGIDVTPAGLRQLASRLTGVGVARNDADPLGPGRRRARPARSRRPTAASTPPRARSPTRSAPRPSGSPPPSRRSTRAATRTRPPRPTSSPRPGSPRCAGCGHPTPTRSCGSSATRSTSRRSTCRARSRPACSRRRRRCSRRRRSAAAPASRPSARRLGLDPDAAPGPVTVTDADGDDDAAARARLRGPRDRLPVRLPRPGAALRARATCPSRATRRGATRPRPRRRRLVDAAGGRALILCTSRAAVERMAARPARRHRPSGARAGRDVEGGAARAVRGRGGVVPRRDPQLLDRRRRPGPELRARGARPAPVRPTRRPARAGPAREGRARGRLRASATSTSRPPRSCSPRARAGSSGPSPTAGVVAVLDRRLATARLPLGAARRAAADAAGRRPRDRGRVPRHLHRVTAPPPGR